MVIAGSWRLLFIKMFRDIKRSVGAYFLSAMIVAVGILSFVTMSLAYNNLEVSKNSFYARTNFADGFVSLVSAPLSMETRLESIYGVREAAGRLGRNVQVTTYPVGEVELRITGSDFSGISVPELIEGRYPQQGEYGMVVSLEFFRARELSVGDPLRVSMNGREAELTVTGVVQSPETVYFIKNVQDMYPDPKAYGAAFMEPKLLSAMMGMPGVANEFVFTLEPGIDFFTVKETVEGVLSPYGVQAVYARKDQTSHSLLQGEIDQLKKTAQVIPALMLSVAAIIIYITLKRLIEQQRSQIGVLKSFGYTNREVMTHYLFYGSAIGLAGGIMGGILGVSLSVPTTRMYSEYFSLPGLIILGNPIYAFIGIAISVFFCTLFALSAVRSVLKLRPAEAMRPQTPSFSQRTIIERIPFLLSVFTMQGRMAIRNLFRNRRRSLLTVIGVSSAFAIMATLLSMYSLIDVFVFDNLMTLQKQDVKVAFDSPVSATDAIRYAQLSGVAVADPIAEVGAKMRSASAERDLVIIGIPSDATLYRLFDQNDNPVELSHDGVTLASHLATLLKVGVGDMVEIQTSYPDKRIEQVTVTDIVPQYIGNNAYMSFEALSAVTVFHNAATSLYIKADDSGINELMVRLKNSPRVVYVEKRLETIQKFRDMLGSFDSIMYTMAMIGVLVGFAVIYTSSIITFEEVKREVAMMRTLGLRSREVLEVVTVEQWILAAVGIVVGIPLTAGASAWLSKAMATDLFSIPNFIDRSSLFLAVYCTVASVWLGSRAIYRKVKRLQPVTVLTERE